jgi:hypothetical protein
MDYLTFIIFFIILLNIYVIVNSRLNRFKMAIKYDLVQILDKNGNKLNYKQLSDLLMSSSTKKEINLKQINDGHIWTRIS